MHDLVFIEGGRFRMGSERFYPEEAPVREVTVGPFWIQRGPVTNAQFAAFVEATGWVTFAEIAPLAEDYPGAAPEMLVPGSLVFTPTAGPTDLRIPANWWRYVPGADWRHPRGPGSTIEDLEQHPVVQVACRDAEAYARWAGMSLPTEAEWECAGRGGLDGAEYAWGDSLEPGGERLANTWKGEFPWENRTTAGPVYTTAVGAFPPNGFGLHDMVGNVWEWTNDWWSEPSGAPRSKPCCVPENPRGGPKSGSYDRADPLRIPRKVLKGGSHLCAPSYCQRYRPAARHPEAIDTSTSHVGFRCVTRQAQAVR